jgi:uncharacterized protein YbaA (DUF1428 family)
MAKYVDGFVLPCPKNKVDEYRKIARKAGKIWREYGALDYVEAVAEDVQPGEVTSFPQSVAAKRNETVIFAWITYRSRKHRDSVNAKVLADPRIAGMDPKDMPIDMQRMVYGGFEVIVQA